MNDVGSSRCQKILLGILTTGRLMGVTVTPIRKGIHKSNCKVLADQAPNPCKLKRLPARKQTLAQSLRGLFTDDSLTKTPQAPKPRRLSRAILLSGPPGCLSLLIRLVLF